MSSVKTRLDTVQRAVDEIALGRPVVVVDDEDRENEGDLTFAAGLATGFAARKWSAERSCKTMTNEAQRSCASRR